MLPSVCNTCWPTAPSSTCVIALAGAPLPPLADGSGLGRLGPGARLGEPALFCGVGVLAPAAPSDSLPAADSGSGGVTRYLVSSSSGLVSSSGLASSCCG